MSLGTMYLIFLFVIITFRLCLHLLRLPYVSKCYSTQVEPVKQNIMKTFSAQEFQISSRLPNVPGTESVRMILLQTLVEKCGAIIARSAPRKEVFHRSLGLPAVSIPKSQAKIAQLHWSCSTTSQLRWAPCMLYKEQCRWPQKHCITHVKSSLKEPQSLQTGHESRSEWNSMSWIRTWFKAWFIVTLHGVCFRRCSQPYNETAKEAVQAARRRAHLSQHVWLHTHTEKIDVKNDSKEK